MATIGPEDVQEALVRAVGLWWRSPGGGRWPFAGDGPWNLIQGEAGDWVETSESVVEGPGGVLRAIRVSVAKPVRTPLDASEVLLRDRVTAWLQLVPIDPVHGALGRRLVWRAAEAMARGEPGPPWSALKRELGWAKGVSPLAWRYRKAICAIVIGLNGWPSTRLLPLAARFRPNTCGENGPEIDRRV